jgi:hypothetical protein
MFWLLGRSESWAQTLWTVWSLYCGPNGTEPHLWELHTECVCYQVEIREPNPGLLNHMIFPVSSIYERTEAMSGNCFLVLAARPVWGTQDPELRLFESHDSLSFLHSTGKWSAGQSLETLMPIARNRIPVHVNHCAGVKAWTQTLWVLRCPQPPLLHGEVNLWMVQ